MKAKPIRYTASMRRRGGPAWGERCNLPPLLRAVALEADRQQVSRRALATIAGVRPVTISSWTQHPQRARFEDVEACLNALGLTIRFAACGKRETAQ